MGVDAGDTARRGQSVEPGNVPKEEQYELRLGEALELALGAGLSKSIADLLELAQGDKDAPHWLQLGPVNRMGGKALIPAELNR